MDREKRMPVSNHASRPSPSIGAHLESSTKSVIPGLDPDITKSESLWVRGIRSRHSKGRSGAGSLDKCITATATAILKTIVHFVSNVLKGNRALYLHHMISTSSEVFGKAPVMV